MFKNMYYFYYFYMFILSLLIFYLGVLFNLMDFCLILEYNIYSLNSFFFCYLIILDWISLIFISVVILISSLVIFYSSIYIGEGSYSYNRFLVILLMFILSMVLMVLSPNLMSIMLGWDGLGLVSYYLVIYYSSFKSYSSGMLTCLINRLGDVGLLICIVWVVSYGSWNFIYYLDFFSMHIFYLLIFSCFTKSAQIPFSSWLPAAMSAPTPISALVHSSTLVTAGIYLIIRFFSYFNFGIWFFFIGMVTMLMSSFSCLFEFDLKKIIAMSTLSQLGLMVCSLFFCHWSLCFFHLISHAMFKSLLFLCSGIIIFYMNDNQDIRLMGSICSFLPFTCSCMNISNLCLCGFPFLSGFYSKDLILDNFFLIKFNIYFFIFLYLCLGLTCFYSFRLFYYSMIYNFKFFCYFGILERLSLMNFSIFILSFFSVFFSCMLIWLMSFNLTFIFLPIYLKVFPFFILLLSFWFSFEFNLLFLYVYSLNFYYFNGNMWFMSSYFYYLYNYFYKLSYLSLLILGWGEFYGPMGLGYYLMKLSSFFQFSLMKMLNFIMFSFFIWLFFFI